jgi:hypothetical protein
MILKEILKQRIVVLKILTTMISMSKRRDLMDSKIIFDFSQMPDCMLESLKLGAKQKIQMIMTDLSKIIESINEFSYDTSDGYHKILIDFEKTLNELNDTHDLYYACIDFQREKFSRKEEV